MKNLFCIIIIFSAGGICNSQNHAPNPGFESYQLCPPSVTIITGTVNNWSSFLGTCDYFNACATTSSQASVPCNMPGYQYAKSGDGYCGFLVGAAGNPSYRELLGAQLNQPLQAGTKYFVSFYLSLADGPGFRLPMNKQGALFSTVAFNDLQPPPVQNFAHVYTDSIVSDTSGWTRVSGSFISDSAYSYVTFGTFFDQQNIAVLSSWQTLFEAYYYIDDVCISADSLFCNGPVGISDAITDREAVVFPNPFEDQLNVILSNIEEAEIILYDVSSRKIIQNKFVSSVTLETGHIGKGIYFFEIRNKNGIIKKGKLMKN